VSQQPVSGAVDVFLSVAREDVAASRELADALAAAGITCFAAASGRSSAEELSALERARAVVLVLSAAANATPDIVRELERAAARGIPIISYAIEEVSPAPSIAYFTVTVLPIPAWSGDRQRSRRILVEAVTRALTESVATPPRSASNTTGYSRVSYADPRTLQIAVGALLVISAGVNAYAFYRDAGFLAKWLLGHPGASVSAQDHLGWTAMASTLGVWAVIVSTIVMFRRARLNLLSFFGSVQTTGREIVWRPIVPIANAVWLPRIARDLRAASDAADVSDSERWPLARYWGLVFLFAYVLAGIRDTLLRLAPQRSASIVGMSAALDLFQVVCPLLTYAVLSHVLDRGRAKHRSRQQPQPSTSFVQTADPVAAEMTSTGPDVLVLYAAGDQTIAASVARGLAEYRCRCWSLNAASDTSTLGANDLAGFSTVLVIVSRASHDSHAIAEWVRSALAGAAPVIPFVVDPPPSGSTLGHYIRSLHWIDSAAGPAAFRGDRVRTALNSSRVGAGVADVPPTPVAAGRFSPLQAAAESGRHYRRAKALRTTARALAAVQIAAAVLVGLMAIGVAFFPESATADASLGLSAYLAAGSLPAWCAFLAWIGTTHSNARALRLPGLGSRAWLLCQAGIPALSLVLGGRAIGRLWAVIRAEAASGWRDEAVRFQVVWTAAGFIWTACAIVGTVLGVQGAIAMAMVVGMVQCLATIARGVLRGRIIKDASARLDDRARRAWQVAD
jgi:hypothetical protein